MQKKIQIHKYQMSMILNFALNKDWIAVSWTDQQKIIQMISYKSYHTVKSLQ